MEKVKKLFRRYMSLVLFVIGRAIFRVGIAISDIGLYFKTRAGHMLINYEPPLEHYDGETVYIGPPKVVRGGCEVQTGCFRRIDCCDEEEGEIQ